VSGVRPHSRVRNVRRRFLRSLPKYLCCLVGYFSSAHISCCHVASEGFVLFDVRLRAVSWHLAPGDEKLGAEGTTRAKSLSQALQNYLTNFLSFLYKNERLSSLVEAFWESNDIEIVKVSEPFSLNSFSLNK
jgi:hypothetical protein